MKELLEEHAAMVTDCMNREPRMSEWETEFIVSIDEQLSNGHHLSGRQTDKLNAIWEKVTAHG